MRIHLDRRSLSADFAFSVDAYGVWSPGDHTQSEAVVT